MDLLKSSNVHRNIFHASYPAIEPYTATNPGFGGFGGVGDFAVFYSLYIYIYIYIFPIGPVWSPVEFCGIVLLTVCWAGRTRGPGPGDLGPGTRTRDPGQQRPPHENTGPIGNIYIYI